jgi:fatty acid desaturase
MTFVEQLLDSVNYPRVTPFSLMWAPVGLRYHALHHLFPSLPYHNLGKAHRRLMAELPADSPYRLTESPSLWASLVQLWRVSRNAGKVTPGHQSPPPMRAGRGQPMAQA